MQVCQTLLLERLLSSRLTLVPASPSRTATSSPSTCSCARSSWSTSRVSQRISSSTRPPSSAGLCAVTRTRACPSRSPAHEFATEPSTLQDWLVDHAPEEEPGRARAASWKVWPDHGPGAFRAARDSERTADSSRPMQLSGFLTTLKGLPATYNKDLQESQEPMFDAAETIGKSLRILTGVISTLKVRASPSCVGEPTVADNRPAVYCRSSPKRWPRASRPTCSRPTWPSTSSARVYVLPLSAQRTPY